VSPWAGRGSILPKRTTDTEERDKAKKTEMRNYLGEKAGREFPSRQTGKKKKENVLTVSAVCLSCANYRSIRGKTDLGKNPRADEFVGERGG